MSAASEIQYTRSGDMSIAYQVVGRGPPDLAFVPFISHLYYFWELPWVADFLRRLSLFSRLLLFDKRGTGLSDRPRDLPTLEARMDDIRAVMDAAGSEQAALLGVLEAGHLAALFAATYPERTAALILFNASARGLQAPDYPWGLTAEEWRARLKEIRDTWGSPEFGKAFADSLYPSLAEDEEACRHMLTWARLSVSPGAAHALYRMAMETDVREVLHAIRAPTLVLFRRPFREQSLDVARRIPHAEPVEVPGIDPGIATGLEVTAVIERFLAGAKPAPEDERVLATILMTDVVDSTGRAAGIGDRAWRELLERYYGLVRSELARHRGDELDTAGDGFFAAFDGPGRAIACGCAIRSAVSGLGLEVRTGIHTGECERVGDKLGGIAVPIGARIAALARPGEVLVSSTVKDLVAGSGIEFEDRGAHELKGVPGEWRLYAVR